MSQLDGERPEEMLIASGERFDFASLTHFDATAVPVISTELTGVISVGRGEPPLGSPLGESCGNRECRYRAFALTLHESRHALLSNYAHEAAKIGAPLELLIEQLARDVYRVRSRDQVRFANLEHQPIRERLGFTVERLAVEPIESPAWELVRRLRDQRRTRAIRLAGAPRAQRLIVHADLAGELAIDRLGTLAEVLPILPAGLGTGTVAASIARRLSRNGD